MEPAFAIGAMWRWRAPVLSDMVAFFTQFGAFPSGAPRPAYTPEAPQGMGDIQATIARLDDVLSPIEGASDGVAARAFAPTAQPQL
jgi:hypothetical protein